MQFSQPEPFSCSGIWDGLTVGICAYPQRYGPKFPADAVSQTIWKLMGQSGWPETKQLWLYPVRKEDRPQMSGLLIQSKVDGIGDDTLVDDALFREIASQNEGSTHATFAPERLTVR